MKKDPYATTMGAQLIQKIWTAVDAPRTCLHMTVHHCQVEKKSYLCLWEGGPFHPDQAIRIELEKWEEVCEAGTRLAALTGRVDRFVDSCSRSRT